MPLDVRASESRVEEGGEGHWSKGAGIDGLAGYWSDKEEEKDEGSNDASASVLRGKL